MLITNFSSGELSKTLFGRIDLPQYHRGAAILENFDVIPTGGIKRRSGMERLLPLDADGRIIPFLVSRELNFLLYLTPGKIQIFRIENGEVSLDREYIGQVEGEVLLYSASEIGEVQYAQNYNTMVMVHENHRPMEVRFENNRLYGSRIFVSTLRLDFDVPVAAGENVTEHDKARYEPDDKQYKNNKWLASEGNYPCAVSFFNGRLVFGGTKNNRQRIFASAVKKTGGDYNFATYKRFLTEKREYATFFGKIEHEDTSVITAVPGYAISTITKPPEKYLVDSQLYPAKTGIRDVNLNRVLLTEPTKPGVKIVDVEGILTELQEKKDVFDDNNKGNDGDPPPAGSTKPDGGTEFVIWTRAWKRAKVKIPDGDGNVNHWHLEEEQFQGTVKCFVRADSIKIMARTKYRLGNTSNWVYNTPNYSPFVSGGINTFVVAITDEDKIKAVIEGREDADRISADIIDKIDRAIATLKGDGSYDPNPYESPEHPRGPIYDSSDFTRENQNPTINPAIRKQESVVRLFKNVRDTMYYELEIGTETGSATEKYYNNPHALYTIINARIINSDITYIAVYTREIIADEYPTPDCGFTFEIASDMNDAVRWLAANKGLIVGTETAEWVIPPDVHANNVQAVLNSRYGSDKTQGTAIGGATCFFQTGKKGLVEYYIPEADNHFRANNMALLAPQMLHECRAKEFDFVSSPYTRLFITREDGVMATLLYERMTGTFAWNRITTGPEQIIDTHTEEDKKRLKKIADESKGQWLPEDLTHLKRLSAGEVKSAAAVPGPEGFDDVYLIVLRHGEYFLERLREDGDVYLDSWQEWKWKTEFEPGEEGNAEDARAALFAQYGQGAVVYDEKANKVYQITEQLPPAADGENPRYIGYPYTSIMRSMPVQVDAKMSHVNIKKLKIRFSDSYMPGLRVVSTMIKQGLYTHKEPCSEVVKADYIDGADMNAQFEFFHDKPNRCCILSVYAEV